MPTEKMLRTMCRSLPLFLVTLAGACSTNLEPDLKKLASDPSLVVVVKDTSNAYWAFGSARIREASGNNLTLKEGTIVAKASGTMSAEEIATELIDLRSKASPGGFGATERTTSGDSGTLSAKIEILSTPTTVAVSKIITSKPEK